MIWSIYNMIHLIYRIMTNTLFTVILFNNCRFIANTTYTTTPIDNIRLGIFISKSVSSFCTILMLIWTCINFHDKRGLLGSLVDNNNWLWLKQQLGLTILMFYADQCFQCISIKKRTVYARLVKHDVEMSQILFFRFPTQRTVRYFFLLLFVQ